MYYCEITKIIKILTYHNENNAEYNNEYEQNGNLRLYQKRPQNRSPKRHGIL